MTHSRSLILPGRLASVRRDEPPATPVLAAPPPPPMPDPAEVQGRERAQLAQILASLGAAAARVQSQQSLPLAELQRVAVEIGFAVACRLTYARIAADEFGVAALVREAVERLRPTRETRVYLHPLDAALLEARHGDALREMMPSIALTVQADASLQRGDCRVEAGEAMIWSELEKHLFEIRDQLLEGLPLTAAKIQRAA